jgi:hypothetical protein
VRIKAGNLLAVLSINVGMDVVLPRRNMRRQINLLSQSHLAFLQGTLEVHILDLFAEIGGLLDQGNETIFNLKSDISAFLHPFLQVATGIDRESLARERRVRNQVHGFDLQDIARRVGTVY